MPYDKSKDIFLNDLEEFTGTFSWDKATLVSNIKAVKPDYRWIDPTTWPRITAEYLCRFEGKDYDGEKVLPKGIVAYDTAVVDNFLQYHSDYYERSLQMNLSPHFTRLTCWKLPRVYLAFPYQFNYRGESRSSIRLTPMMREWYIKNIALLRLTRKWEKSEEESESKKNARFGEAEDSGPDALQNAYKQILQMLAESSKNNMQELDIVKGELKRTQDSLMEEKKRADTAKETSKALEHKLSERDDQLTTARKEATDANNMVMKIWAEMKKTHDSGPGKRKAEGHGSTLDGASPAKKSRSVAPDSEV